MQNTLYIAEPIFSEKLQKFDGEVPLSPIRKIGVTTDLPQGLEQVIALNALNPQIAARLLTPLTRWRRYDEKRQELMKAELERVMTTEDLSKDVFEVVSKSLR